VSHGPHSAGPVELVGGNPIARPIKGVFLILAVAGLAVAVPVAFATAGAGGAPSATASKKKKCKKGQKRVKGKCKKKGAGAGGGSGGGEGTGSPPPTAQAGGPQLGDYAGDTVMRSFSVVKGPAGSQGRVYLFAYAPYSAACPGPLALSISEKTIGVEPILVKDNRFSFNESSGNSSGESSSTVLNGEFTSPTTAHGTVRFTLTGGGAAPCDTGELAFKVTKK
jgi:hypothetical protein